MLYSCCTHMATVGVKGLGRIPREFSNVSGVTMGWLLRLVTGGPARKGARDSFRVLND